MKTVQVDVVVVGSGLAGISAAVEAARAGAQVALLTAGTLCEGSSFSPHTWGLGMVSPTNLDEELRHDPHSLLSAIQRIGAFQSKTELVEALVTDAAPAIDFLASLSATLSTPDNPDQQAYVPCFDDRVRCWHGFKALESQAALQNAVRNMQNITVYEHTRALSIVQAQGVGSPVTGVVASGRERGDETGPVGLVQFVAPSVVLATGGLSSVFEHSFGGTGYLAATMAHDAGASFLNLEFMQLMLGFASHPYGTICNEKLWRWATVQDERGVSVFQSAGMSKDDEREALEAHSWHGPFTTARPSKALELAVQSAEAAGHRAYLHLSEELLSGTRPEFVDVYLNWLRDKGVDPRKPAPITLFAHSSNGGIAIDAQGATNVPGLYAAGECAGGVHGADRVGGLASVTAVVFGRRAGVAASRHAAQSNAVEKSLCPASPFAVMHDGLAVSQAVGKIMGAHGLVNRTEQGLSAAIEQLDAFLRDHSGPRQSLDTSVDAQAAFESLAVRGKVVAAQMMARAMLHRQQSLGSHHRADER